MPNTTNKLLRAFHLAEDGLLVIFVLAMVGFSTVQILLRNFFDSGIPWISPLLGVLVLWVGLLGATVATRQRAHIKINVLSSYLPGRFKTGSQIATDMFSALISGVLAYYAVEFIKLDLDSTVTAFANVPVWLAELILPVSFSLIAARFFIHAVLQVPGLFQREHD